ncbi:hypothetical protein BDY24DRAFT_387304 [Mrakia frigida]|uniref:5-formyltetrahydrofolate cyclo-ligase n=1 Tax=Mrakia frigida TaxID=29902 RepID=UPI003FCC178F
MSSPLPTLKRTLRKSVQATLKSLPPSAVSEQSIGLLNYLLSSPIYTSSRSLSVYLSMPHSEIQTLPLIADALSKGKRVFVPFIPKGGHMSMVRVYEGEDLGSNRDNWGIPVVGLEREDGSKREDANSLANGSPPLDLILCPGVAFSPTPSTTLISRLGHGKGYYDRYITSYRAFSSSKGVEGPTLVGVALREQWLPEAGSVPTGEYDVGIDEVWMAPTPTEE